MQFKEIISKELRDILKSCTTVSQRKQIAESNKISIHTLNSVLEGKRKISHKTKKCLLDLVRMAIWNSRNMKMSLLEYYKSATI